MNYNIISTGSKGNALVINKKILIDCGVTFAKLKDFYKSFQLVLLTHIHSDHFNKSTIKIIIASKEMCYLEIPVTNFDEKADFIINEENIL